jgi:lysylphosphatidylglycerol synthetase-like protein (DUF2156 family)
MSGGLQSERTELAWLRTMLSSWAVAVLTARTAFPVGMIAVTGPVAVTVIAHRRRRRLAEAGTPPSLRPATAILLAAACAAIAVTAALLV